MNLFSGNPPFFHVFGGTTNTADQYVAKLRFERGAGTVIRLLRGKNMESMDGVYKELAAALQFPLYSGRNWDALDECLADLEWMPAEAYLLFFADATSILKSGTEKDRDMFFQLLLQNCEEWARGKALSGTPGRGPTPFHVVFQAEASESARFLDGLEVAIGQPVAVIAGADPANP